MAALNWNEFKFEMGLFNETIENRKIELDGKFWDVATEVETLAGQVTFPRSRPMTNDNFSCVISFVYISFSQKSREKTIPWR